MAHRKNPRTLRSFMWRSPVFCQYVQRKGSKKMWTDSFQTIKKRTGFSKRLFQKLKKNIFIGKKRNPRILNDTRARVYSSHYKNRMFPLFYSNTSLIKKKKRPFFKQKKKNDHRTKKFF